ncbi:MAG: (2Fe-2S)-binding protein, partial [Candidatus Puniceispirillaceae bacterium]
MGANAGNAAPSRTPADAAREGSGGDERAIALEGMATQAMYAQQMMTTMTPEAMGAAYYERQNAALAAMGPHMMASYAAYVAYVQSQTYNVQAYAGMMGASPPFSGAYGTPAMGAAAASSGRLAAGRIVARAKGASLFLAPIWQALKWRQTAIRPFLDHLFTPPEDWRVPQDETAVVCRCEALTKADVSAAIALGVSGPNQLKTYCRAGMGRCQGRMCSLTIQKMIHDHNGGSEDEIGYLRIRPPIRPLTVGELAALANEDAGK